MVDSTPEPGKGEVITDSPIVPEQKTAAAMHFYDLECKTIDGKPFPFSQLRGKTVLIVNVASKCGFTGDAAPA